MLNSVLGEILKVFVLDIIVVLSLFVILYFLIVLINSIRNGKNHKITKNSIMTYSFDCYIGAIKKNCDQLVKWGLILFCAHLIFTFFDSVLSWLQAQITYDSVPIVALTVDIIKPIFQVIKPFVVPVVVILGLGLIIYALVKTGQQVSRKNAEQSRLVKAVSVSNNDSNVPELCKISKGEGASYFAENLQHGFLAILKIIPKLFIIIAVCVSINSLFLGMNNITKIVDNYKKIDELNLTVKNLSNSEAFARISLMKELPRQDGTPLKTYKIDILGQDGDIISSQTVQLQGKEIVIDSININFDYSKIAKGEKYNIAYPYRVYSETMAPSLAKDLKCIYNDENIPVIFCLEKADVYGLENDVFYSRLKEIFEIIKDENLSKEAGIKSTIGNALRFVMHENDVIDISIEGTGGISASPHETLFD